MAGSVRLTIFAALGMLGIGLTACFAYLLHGETTAQANPVAFTRGTELPTSTPRPLIGLPVDDGCWKDGASCSESKDCCHECVGGSCCTKAKDACDEHTKCCSHQPCGADNTCP